jgi:hypothetical protein
MKVKFPGLVPEYHPATGLDLVPGTFVVDDDKGAQLVAAGLVKEVPEVLEVEAPTAQDAAPAAANARRGRG